MHTRIAVFLIALFAGTMTFAQNKPAPPANLGMVGEWETNFDTGQGKKQGLLHVSRAKGGGLTAVIDSVTDDAYGIPIDVITYKQPAVHFEALGGAFDGTMSADGSTITGEWKLNGESIALPFKRITAQRVAEIMSSAPKKLNIAFVISDDFNLIDFAGPWEVFADVMRHVGGQMQHPIHTYTVAADTKPVNSRGAVVVPQYTFANALQPDIIVIPAQSGSPALLDWLRTQNAKKTTIMSVCTGASILAESGLIDGRPATSHHEALDDFVKTYPKVQWQREQRWVRSTENIYTAGGLTSGIDLALHMVEVKFGREMAQDTADYLEYKSDGWKRADASAAVLPPFAGPSDEGTMNTKIRREGASDLSAADTKVRAKQ